MTSESTNSKQVRLDFAINGDALWRNNVGVLVNERGIPIRFGLANESKAMNKRIKSSDLIGIQKVLITQDMVGQTIGQFVAREMKSEGWVYTGTERERAQLRFIELIIACGGDARFSTGD